MAISAKEYYEGVLKQAGVSEAKRQALISQLEDPELAKALADDAIAPRLRQEEFSRNMDLVRQEKEKTTKYYADLLAWKAEQDRILAEAANGGRTVNNGGEVVNGEYLTKKELEALKKEFSDELSKMSTNQITITKMMGRLASQHVVEFREPLDVDALEKVAVEKNLPLPQAYAEMVAGRRASLSEEQRKAELAKAREEGAKEFASKHKIPVDTQPREYHVLLDRDPKKQVGVDDYVPNSGQLSPRAEQQLRENFRTEWESYKPGANTSGT